MSTWNLGNFGIFLWFMAWMVISLKAYISYLNLLETQYDYGGLSLDMIRSWLTVTVIGENYIYIWPPDGEENWE